MAAGDGECSVCRRCAEPARTPPPASASGPMAAATSMMQSVRLSVPPSTLSLPRRRTLERCTGGARRETAKRTGWSTMAARMVTPVAPLTCTCERYVLRWALEWRANHFMH
eukprot:4510494-Prymnesium_polylepis.1